MPAAWVRNPRKRIAECIQVQLVLAAAMKDARELLDLRAEDTLYERAMRGDLRATQLYLATERR